MTTFRNVSKRLESIVAITRNFLLTSVCAVAVILPQTAAAQTVTITSQQALALLCGGTLFNVTYTVSAPFSNVPTANVFSVQLSNAAGSFTGSPTSIGAVSAVGSGSISCLLPSTVTPSGLYRIRIVSTNPATVSQDNGANLILQTPPATPSNTVFGNGAWNVYCFGSGNWTNYMGYYTENGSGTSGYDFNSQTRWSQNTSPSNADASSGSAYAGCAIEDKSNFSTSHRRTNFACGYYRIDLAHDDYAAILVNGLAVFASSLAVTDNDAWRGFLGPNSQVEILHFNTSGASYLSASIYTIQPLLANQPVVTMCAGSTTLNVNFVSGCSYSWSPATALSATTGTTTVASPTVSTIYTCTISHAVSSCTSAIPIGVTISSLNAISTSPVASTLICPAQPVVLTAGGANTYTWSPATGLSSTTGYAVSASPTVSTIYTVTGSNNCSLFTATTLVSAVPPLVNPTVFPSGAWNVYCFNDAGLTNYSGYYTENGSGTSGYDFNSITRWTLSPSSANASSGQAYVGCPILTGTSYGTSHRRTNFTCGYYRIDLTHDDQVAILVNGVAVFANAAAAVDNNAWSGFLGPNSQVEIRHGNGTGGSFIAASFIPVQPFSISPPNATMCGGSATLSVNYAPGCSYIWSPATALSTTNGTLTVASPVVNTTYTCTITEPINSCSVAVPVSVSISTLNSTSVGSSTVILGNCASQSAVLTASGANTYTWSPSTGLSATTGYSVSASPSVSTIYTVTGNNNCTVATATTLVFIPALVNPTVFPSGAWNVYCYNSPNGTNYYGYYTENGSGPSGYSFNSTSRFTPTSSPSSANASSGQAYVGCAIPNGTVYSTIHKRTNFACGYYRVDLGHNQAVGLFINGVAVFTNLSSGTDNDVWRGFLDPTSQVELRHFSSAGSGSIAASIYTLMVPSLSPPVSICGGSSTSLTAGFVSGCTYSWSPAAGLSTTTGTAPVASPVASTIYTCTVSNPSTSCTFSASTSVSVGPTFTTTATPSVATSNCSAGSFTLVAGGANTYTWSPATGLNTTTGASVVASPSVTTVYTISGSNNCSIVTATALVSVPVMLSPTVFPSGTWNAYCFNSLDWTNNYYGYYTENGSGPSGYDFNTTTRWAATASPSMASASNGSAYVGCAVPPDYFTISFKRTGFACNTYTVRLLSNDDDMALYINGVLMVQRVQQSTPQSIWSGVLSQNTTVELRLRAVTGLSSLNVEFLPAPVSPTLAVWSGGTSNNWATPSNWCGSSVPTASVNALINSSGTIYQPVISSGAACKNLTISAGVTAVISGSTAFQAIPPAILTLSNGINVFGDWINYGGFSGISGTLNLVGTGSRTLMSTTSQVFGNLWMNFSGTVSVPSGTHSVFTLMQLNNGVMSLNGGELWFATNAVATNSNTSSYVDGAVLKVGNQAFTFPVGGAGNYRPISISAPGAPNHWFTARYFRANPSPTYNNTSKDATLNNISTCEYWQLDQINGPPSSVSVTLSWDPNCWGVGYLPDLRVARWDAGLAQWKDMGNGAMTGNTSAGTVTSGSLVSSFGPFALASTSILNTLPIELLSLEATCTQEDVTVRWSTATENANSMFTLERSTDGVNFSYVTSVKGWGTSGMTREYQVSDKRSAAGVVYYRLMQTDYNLEKRQLMTTVADCGATGDHIILFPNPTSQSFRLKGLKGQADVYVTDMFGRIVLQQTVRDDSAEISLDGQVNGVYLVRVKTGNFVTALKVVKN